MEFLTLNLNWECYFMALGGILLILLCIISILFISAYISGIFVHWIKYGFTFNLGDNIEEGIETGTFLIPMILITAFFLSILNC